jgi:hypothetical protein
VFEEVRNDEPEAAGTERSGDAEKDRAIVGEHAFPDPPGRRKVPGLERDLFHPDQEFIGGGIRTHGERLDRHLEEA